MATNLAIVLDLHYENPNKHRFNCPFCGRANSLSISEDQGTIRYFCFGASCRTKGVHHTRLSIEQIQSNRILDRSAEYSNALFDPPSHFCSALDRVACRHYLIANNCLGAVIQERVHVRYEVTNATGRLLGKPSKEVPKWWIYGNSKDPFVAGNKDTAIVVEDCASASCVSHLATGMALLGTNFKETNLTGLRKYKRIVIALDKDAVRKACEIEASVRYFANTSILMLNEDLKRLDAAHLYEFLGTHINLDEIKDL
jgi:hypothetical protein